MKHCYLLVVSWGAQSFFFRSCLLHLLCAGQIPLQPVECFAGAWESASDCLQPHWSEAVRPRSCEPSPGAKSSCLPGRSALSQVIWHLPVSANLQGQQQQRRSQLQEFLHEICFDTWLPNVLDHLISCLLLSENNAYALAFLAFFFLPELNIEIGFSLFLSKCFLIFKTLTCTTFGSSGRRYCVWKLNYNQHSDKLIKLL